MRRLIVCSLILWLSHHSVSEAQQSFRPAEECDCDNSCLPSLDTKSQTVFGTDQTSQLGAWTLRPRAGFSDSLQEYLDQDKANRLSNTFESGDVTQQLSFRDFAVEPSNSMPAETIRLSQSQFGQLFDDSDWRESLSRILERESSPFKVVNPVLSGGGNPLSDVYNVPQSRVPACRIAVGYSQEESTLACAERVEALCAKESCEPEDLRARMTERDQSDKLTEGALKTVALVAEYDALCLENDGNPDLFEQSHFDLDYIRSRSGVLRLNADTADFDCGSSIDHYNETAASDGVLCSAAVLDKNTIVTARHCLVTQASRWNFVRQCIKDGALEFLSYSSPDDPIVVGQIVDEADVLARSGGATEDYAKLTLQDEVPGIESPTDWRSPEPFDEVFIMAYHLFAPAVPDEVNGWPRWRRKVRWTKPRCAVTRVNDGCAVTKCQTIAGYSGVPVWTHTASGQSVLSAIQVEGGTQSFATCNPASPQRIVGQDANLAIWGFANE